MPNTGSIEKIYTSILWLWIATQADASKMELGKANRILVSVLKMAMACPKQVSKGSAARFGGFVLRASDIQAIGHHGQLLSPGAI